MLSREGYEHDAHDHHDDPNDREHGPRRANTLSVRERDNVIDRYLTGGVSLAQG